MTSTEGVTARTVANGHNLDISLRSALPGSFNAHAGHVLQASFTQSELVEASNYSSLFYVDGYITGLKQRLNMTLHFERYELLSVEGRPTFHFLDVFARFRIRQDKQFLVFVNARNLLNETVYGQRAVSPQGVAVTANQLMPRYVLLGLEIRW
jgi:outer membrane receptor protein involved in Fe transport